MQYIYSKEKSSVFCRKRFCHLGRTEPKVGLNSSAEPIMRSVNSMSVYYGFNTSLKNSACHQLDLIFSRGNILHKKTTWVNDGSGKKDLRSWKTLPLELLHSYLMHIWTSFIRYHPNIINQIYTIWPNCNLIFYEN